MATWTSGSYEGRYLQLTITETVNVAANTSTLNWTLTSAGGSANYYTVDATTVTINGTQVYYKARTDWDDRVFPAALLRMALQFPLHLLRRPTSGSIARITDQAGCSSPRPQAQAHQ